jgi:hypothetical protein
MKFLVLAILTMLVYNMTVAQEPTPFNMGRTRAFAGFFFFNDGKSLLHTITYKKDSLSSVQVKIAESNWSKKGWSTPKILHLTSGNESIPILNGNKLYFTTSIPLENTQTTDLNIWYSEMINDIWGMPVALSNLNTDKNDRLCFIDSNGSFYLSSERNGNYDLFRAERIDNQWKITPIEVWNSKADEAYVSINSELGIALIQRTEPGKHSEILISYRQGGHWLSPEPLNYPCKNTHPFYSQRTPMISDNSTFHFTQNGLLWWLSLSDLSSYNQNKIKHTNNPKIYPIKPAKPKEPHLFGNIMLKTNNGISFNKELNKIYLSQYTSDKDSVGNFYLKIFESELKNDTWEKPKIASFNNPVAPFEYHPVVSAYDNSIYYNSRAPVINPHKYESKNNIWQWTHSDSKPIAQTITASHDDYACQAKSGNLYFRSDHPGGKGLGDIYVCLFENGKLGNPVAIDALNSEFNENDLCIDPEERFIIFNRYSPISQEMQLYLSINTSKGWSKPRKITLLERSEDWELTPTISPDKKYFYYEVNSNIFRIELMKLFNKEELKSIRVHKPRE